MDFRAEKMTEEITHLAGDFITNESNHTSLITVTKVELEKDFKKALIFVTVLPETQENAAMDFLKRQRSDFKHFVKKKSRMSRIPQFDFIIDAGEKSRQRIEEISHEIKSGNKGAEKSDEPDTE